MPEAREPQRYPYRTRRNRMQTAEKDQPSENSTCTVRIPRDPSIADTGCEKKEQRDENNDLWDGSSRNDSGGRESVVGAEGSREG